MDRLRIITWNLLHPGGAEVEHVQGLIALHRPDLLLMQEVSEKIDSLPGHIGGHYTRVSLPGRPHGLAAWSPHPFHAPAQTITLQRGLLVQRVCQIIRLGAFTVANVHLSHGQMLNRRQLRHVAGTLPERAAILGACNILGAPFLPGFTDAGGTQATHLVKDIIPLRLDRCFIRGLTCESAEALNRGASDHCPLMVVLTSP